MIFLITERYETVKEQYTDVLGKIKLAECLYPWIVGKT